ncbi:unnamed protein product [Brassicogethes aeneus]|uniref:Uncharacterized protein n=1 Tax=Brassicogethes aeneus TaxID=1431903 RepID=A0A9P0FNK1_BRAAE|nr:unnamed protein product [Brassicogethes aeneus]
MRTIFALAFLALASAGPLKDEPTEVIAAKKFINECVKNVLINGLPEINIPSHEPLKLNVNITYGNFGIPNIFEKFYIHINNAVIEGIPEFELIELVSHPENNPNGVFFDYTISWKSMVIKNDWELIVLGWKYAEGQQNIYLIDTTISGTWNMTNAQSMQQSLDALTANIKIRDVELVLDNTKQDIFAMSFGRVINQALNIPAVSEALSAGLLNKFNVDWLQKGERIDAMLNYCWPKY